jgi:hypothetical protein
MNSVKITDFQTPLGAKGNILNPKDWVGLILGGVVLIASFAMAQNFSRAISRRVPAFDSSIEQPWSPAPVMSSFTEEVI